MRLVDTDGTERFAGVRCSDPDVVEILRARFGDSVMPDMSVFPNVSLKIGTARGGRREAHKLIRRGLQSMLTFDLETAIEATVWSVHGLAAPPPGVVPLHGRALIRNGTATILVEALTVAVDQMHRDYATAGCERVLHSPLWVDAERAELLVPRGDPALPQFDRVPVGHLVGYSQDPVDRTSVIGRLVYLTPFITGHGCLYSSLHDLRCLLALSQRVNVVMLKTQDRREVLQGILAL